MKNKVQIHLLSDEEIQYIRDFLFVNGMDEAPIYYVIMDKLKAYLDLII